MVGNKAAGKIKESSEYGFLSIQWWIPVKLQNFWKHLRRNSPQVLCLKFVLFSLTMVVLTNTFSCMHLGTPLGSIRLTVNKLRLLNFLRNS